MYFNCSGVIVSIEVPMLFNLRRATSLSMSCGTTYTVFWSFFACFTRYSTESAWFANDMSMTMAGCPSAAARLMRRPSPSRNTRLPPFRRYSSTNGRATFLLTDMRSSAGMSISTLKWPEFATIAPSFMAAKCSRRSTDLLPVTVMNRSPRGAASAMATTWLPSIAASSARTGSISVTSTVAPMPFARAARPRPHQP